LRPRAQAHTIFTCSFVDCCWRAARSILRFRAASGNPIEKPSMRLVFWRRLWSNGVPESRAGYERGAGAMVLVIALQAVSGAYGNHWQVVGRQDDGSAFVAKAAHALAARGLSADPPAAPVRLFSEALSHGSKPGAHRFMKAARSRKAQLDRTQRRDIGQQSGETASTNSRPRWKPLRSGMQQKTFQSEKSPFR
jgi:hypothetical protein